MKRPQEFTNILIRLHAKLNLEGTNNTVFQQAITAPINDKKQPFNNELKKALGIPSKINNYYDMKVNFGVYERLYDFVIISLCSDIEFLFKDLFSQLFPNTQYKFGFYQRLNDVIKELENKGFDFTIYQLEIEHLKLAFQIRHIGIHNMGFVDEGFLKNINSNYTIGTKLVVSKELYNTLNNSYSKFLECLDQNLIEM